MTLHLHSQSYLEALDGIGRDSVQAMMARSRMASSAARAALAAQAPTAPGAKGGLLADPVFELRQDWKTASKSWKELLGETLHRDLGKALESARLPLERRPFLHQLQAFEATLKRKKSFIVSSGTGSGKTECFLAPVVSDCLSLKEAEGLSALSAVRAIALYPLNALIASQETRLEAWMKPYRGALRYALYTGDTPNEAKADLKRIEPWKVHDRKTLRADPPPLLVTNITMLEYMLTRREDVPILEASRGKLRWIILDEAHSYVGAQAADLAMLLRRAREGFQVKPEDCRILAVSATVGAGQETRDQLRRFVADVGGFSPDQVEAIEGAPLAPALPPQGPDFPFDALALAQEEPDRLWRRFGPHPRARQAREALKDGASLTDLTKILGEKDDAEGRNRTFACLEAMARAKDPASDLRFAPWRMHAFQRAMPGLWCCVDPACPKAAEHMGEARRDWPFGAIYAARREACDCGARVFEICFCGACGAAALRAREAGGDARCLEPPPDQEDIDDYALDREPPSGEDGAPSQAVGAREMLLRPPPALGGGRWIDRASGRLWDAAPSLEAQKSAVRLALDKADEGARGCCGAQAIHAPLRRLRFGAPFMMGVAAPRLLRAAQPDEKGGACDGRKLISFTDSRQGTARLSAKLQQESERALTRAAIYHLAHADTGPSPETEKLRQEINAFEATPNLPDLLRAALPEKKKELEKRLNGTGALLKDIEERLSGLQDFGAAVKVWRGSKRDDLGREPRHLARMFLLREIFRRPRTQNNIETMGLGALFFPALEELGRQKPSKIFLEKGLGVEDWIAFLRLCVDFVFRESLAVHVEEDLRHWASPSRYTREMLAPGSKLAPVAEGGQRRARRNRTSFTEIFPLASTHPDKRVVRLLSAALGLNPKNPADCDRLDEVLRAAWAQFESSKTIVAEASAFGHYRLDIGKAALAAPKALWLCPVTRRFFSYALADLSPYAAEPATGPKMERHPALPRPPLLSPVGFDADKRREVEAWLASEPRIKALREEGLWTDLQDRIVSFHPFLRSAEHSAQLTRHVLRRYEEEFSEGAINILNCSTTMEMGVDLAGVDIVLNANVPPAPANYRQRIGRAGRRGQATALAYTFCKDTPIERAAFDDPIRRLLKGEMRPPQADMSSRILMRRHVNIFLLGRYLRSPEGIMGGSIVKTEIGPFMGAHPTREEPFKALSEEAPIHRFIALLKGDWRENEALQESARRLVRGTALERTPDLLVETAEAAERLFKGWKAEFDALRELAEVLEGKAKTALGYQIRSLSEAFLLSELARRGFAPAYGFPVDVVAFTPNRLAAKGDEAERRESPFAEGPTRTLDIAIRDYAPGGDVVADGLVYRSGGLRPAWSLTAHPGQVEDLRSFWFCGACGAFGETLHEDGKKPEACPDCGAAGAVRMQTILRPAGFVSVGKPHASYEDVSFVPPRAPLAQALGAEWISLSDPAVGRMRATHEGRVLQSSAGSIGHGYCVCLACGRAEPESAPAEASSPPPAGMIGHAPLYAGGEAPGDEAGVCRGGDVGSFSLQRHILLGRTMETDVFELQFQDCPSETAAFTLAASLREALAARLSIDAEEIGFSARETVAPDGRSLWSLLLHDGAAGGAGYATLAAVDVGGLLKSARAFLDCKDNCKAACPRCVLRRDAQFSAARLDRRAALAFLETVLRRLDIPEALRLFGEKTCALETALISALREAVRCDPGAELDLFLTEDDRSWSLPDWPAAALLEDLRDSGAQMRLYASASVLARLDFRQRLSLQRLLLLGRSRLFEGVAPAMTGGRLLAILRPSSGSPQGFAAAAPAAAQIGPDWGSAAQGPILSGPISAPPLGREIDQGAFVQPSANALALKIGRELDGPIGDFGRKFWALLSAREPRLKGAWGPLAALTYEDRYVNSPLTLRLLHEAIRHAPGLHAGTKIRLMFADFVSDVTPYKPWNNWRSARDRDQAARALIKSADVSSSSVRSHPRTMSLVFGSAKVEIGLDQGFGAWSADYGASPFPFGSSLQKQAEDLERMRFSVALASKSGAPVAPTLAFVMAPP